MYWKDEILQSPIAIDTETEMITHPGMTPRLVISSVSDGQRSFVIKNQDLESFLTNNAHATFIMHNAPFDVSVIQKFLKWNIFEKDIENDTLFDTQIMYQLVHLAEKGIVDYKTGLAKLSELYLNKKLNKDESIRLNFGSFIKENGNVDYNSIPLENLNYAIEDALSTRQLYDILSNDIKQLEHKYNVHDTLLSHKIQLLGAIALDQISKNGIGFNLAGKTALLDSFEKEILTHRSTLSQYGFERGVKGSKKVFEDVVNSFGLILPRTATGKMSSAADDLKPHMNNEFINAYVKFHEIEKLASFVKDINEDRIHPRYKLLMNTGRTSSFGPNIQQLPRAGGIREMFIPVPGHVFLDIDYNFLELCTLAQTTYNMYGHSEMMDQINQGKDLHIYAASRIYGVNEFEVTKGQRQLAKILNFGLGANMSGKTFVEYSSGYGVTISEEEASLLKREWTTIFPEMRRFWNQRDTTNVLRTGRVRKDCTYTAMLNTYFQGLAADGAKISLYLLWKAGFKTVAFIHDQVLIEVPENEAEKALQTAQELMIQGMKIVCPNVKIAVEGKITTCFSK